jgi:hypothetical protein
MDPDGSVTAALKSPNGDFSENKPIEHYIEVAGHRYVATSLTLAQSMPCSIILGDCLCGRGATVGGVIPNPDGTWLLMPVCAQCCREIAILDEAFANLI